MKKPPVYVNTYKHYKYVDFTFATFKYWCSCDCTMYVEFPFYITDLQVHIINVQYVSTTVCCPINRISKINLHKVSDCIHKLTITAWFGT